jgi:glycosyltransferase involved in cell wall biosynthesis
MNIVIITPVPFPVGMASTQRVALLGHIASQKHNVKIFITRVPPDGIDNHNPVPKGNHNNIRFEYLTGTNKRSSSFIVRRLIEVWGSLNTIFSILRLRANHLLDCIYLYGDQRKFTFFDFLVIILANLIKIPVARELCERTWAEKEGKNHVEKWVSPLFGISGVICISEYLEAWAVEEKHKSSFKTHIIQVPILVDEKEFDSLDEDEVLVDNNFVLFSGAPEYVKTISFVLEAMKYVLNKYPEEKLLITGFDFESKRAEWLKDFLARDQDTYKNIRVCGFLNRSKLLKTMKSADSLLLPLFNDQDSIARFPTKLGEYLLSGKPIVTCNVGEVEKYLIDGHNALVCIDITPKSFAKKIIESKQLLNTAEIGARGMHLARTKFAPDLYTDKVSTFFTNLVKR